MANDMRYLSAEEEAKLLKPIDEYVGKIQGTDRCPACRWF